MAKHNQIGKLGEDIAVTWLSEHGFVVLERNYRKKWGEIDIIASEPSSKDDSSRTLHFFEVKAVSYETRSDLEYAVTHETWRPEEMVHAGKLKKLSRAIQTWVIENKHIGEVQIDVLTVRVVPREKYAKVKSIENIVIQ